MPEEDCIELFRRSKQVQYLDVWADTTLSDADLWRRIKAIVPLSQIVSCSASRLNDEQQMILDRHAVENMTRLIRTNDPNLRSICRQYCGYVNGQHSDDFLDQLSAMLPGNTHLQSIEFGIWDGTFGAGSIQRLASAVRLCNLEVIDTKALRHDETDLAKRAIESVAQACQHNLHRRCHKDAMRKVHRPRQRLLLARARQYNGTAASGNAGEVVLRLPGACNAVSWRVQHMSGGCRH